MCNISQFDLFPHSQNLSGAVRIDRIVWLHVDLCCGLWIGYAVYCSIRRRDERKELGWCAKVKGDEHFLRRLTKISL